MKVSGFEMFYKCVRLYAAGPGGASGSRSVLGAAASKCWGCLLPVLGRQEQPLLPVSLSLSVRPSIRGSARAPSGEQPLPCGRLSLERVGPCTVPSNVHF